MHVHQFEKLWIGVSLVLIVGFIATVIFGYTIMNFEVVGDEGGQVDPAKLMETPFGTPGVRKIGEDHYAAYVLAQQYLFRPGTGQPLTLPANSKITFYVTSPDVLHGFEVVGTGLNIMAIPGQIAKFSTVFPEPGTYGMLCNEYCGAAHHAMEGLIEVVPKEQFADSTLVESANG